MAWWACPPWPRNFPEGNLRLTIPLIGTRHRRGPITIHSRRPAGPRVKSFPGARRMRFCEAKGFLGGAGTKLHNADAAKCGEGNGCGEMRRNAAHFGRILGPLGPFWGVSKCGEMRRPTLMRRISAHFGGMPDALCSLAQQYLMTKSTGGRSCADKWLRSKSFG